MTGRYAATEPYEAGMLEVSDHQLVYWETVGDPAGTPALFLHGGPGAGCSPGSRRYFDPQAYRAVLFDQRGCGRSLPSVSATHADLSVNTTDRLLDDIERLRAHLGIDRWVIFGGSWGVTLGLVYAQRHPDRILAMVLGAVTSGRRRETDWITRDMGRVFPREWDRFMSLVPEAERDGDPAAAYARMLTDPDPAVRSRAAHEWCVWEDTHVSLAPGWQPRLQLEDPEFQLTFARLVTHYWSNGSFLADDEVASRMPRLAGIPAILVHGRYDISSPLDTAWELHKLWPRSRLVVLDNTGHSGDEMTGALVAALDSFRGLR